MSCVSDWQNRSCFVWVVELPLVNRSRHSPKFAVAEKYGYNVEFSLRMSSNGHDYRLDAVYCKGAIVNQSSRTPSYSVSTTVHVENKEGLALPRSCKRTINGNDNCMWCCKISEILKYIPNFLTEGVLVFLVTFPETMASYKFEIKPPKGDPLEKSVQTEEDGDSDQREAKGIQNTSLSTNSSLSCLEALSDDLSKLLDDDSQPDVQLTCGDEVAKAHRNVLSTRSEVFAAALNDLADGGTGRIDVQNVESGIFRHFVRYLYTGTLPYLTVETAVLFYEAGCKYAVRGLKRRCSCFFAENLDPENACATLVLADSHRDRDLKEIVMAYILQKDIPLMEGQWMVFSSSHPRLATEVLYHFYRSQRNK